MELWGKKTKKDYTAIILQQTLLQTVYAWETLSYTEGMF